MIKKNLILFLLLSIITTSFGQNPPQVSSTISADSMWIGDQVIYSLEIHKDLATEIGLPQFQDNKLTEKIEIVDGPWVDTISQNGREIALNINYKITSFDAGEYVLQGFPLVYGNMTKPDTIKVQTVNHLFVKTFEIDTTQQEIFDIKENIETPITWEEIKAFIFSWKGLVVLSAVALLAIIIWVYIWFKKRHNNGSGKPKEPAHIIAFRALNALEKKKMWESGKVKEYYSILTDIIRSYIDNRYDVSTMELTTPEILEAIKDMNSEKQYELLSDLLSESDLVKFAKMIPVGEDNVHYMEVAREYIDETKMIIVEEEEKDEK